MFGSSDGDVRMARIRPLTVDAIIPAGFAIRRTRCLLSEPGGALSRRTDIVIGVGATIGYVPRGVESGVMYDSRVG
jgi:hypothetical protein